ncbi:hypothetical protein DEO72_LG1g3048 [Vigna unguiculata]|uniref:Bifunctional inhibitor/plant lipid transfer protein/seed storage helical domain-containing protein n=1 Tax=Vigna unguiculata TaxID=3917 RepID=A0A4D6KP04_VIGUN|nr:hypothetical protein DEO72_LG1g3048 [Vigna unguiculata]
MGEKKVVGVLMFVMVYGLAVTRLSYGQIPATCNGDEKLLSYCGLYLINNVANPSSDCCNGASDAFKRAMAVPNGQGNSFSQNVGKFKNIDYTVINQNPQTTIVDYKFRVCNTCNIICSRVTHYTIIAKHKQIGKNKQQPLPVDQNSVRALLSLGLTRNHPCLLTKIRQEHNPYLFTKTRVPNSSDNTEESNLPEPIRTSHDLAHSTGLPKPSGYNLEWPRVTPIQVALVTRPLAKHRIKTFIQSYVESLV